MNSCLAAISCDILHQGYSVHNDQPTHDVYVDRWLVGQGNWMVYPSYSSMDALPKHGLHRIGIDLGCFHTSTGLRGYFFGFFLSMGQKGLPQKNLLVYIRENRQPCGPQGFTVWPNALCSFLFAPADSLRKVSQHFWLKQDATLLLPLGVTWMKPIYSLHSFLRVTWKNSLRGVTAESLKKKACIWVQYTSLDL